MKVLVIIAHANPMSFNHAVLEAFTRGLDETRKGYLDLAYRLGKEF